MFVSQMINAKGNAVKNQFILNTKKGIGFQSYESLIAFKADDNIYLSDKWDYSATTLKYLKAFLGITDSKKQIQSDIEKGIYVVVSESELKSMLD